MVQVQMHQTPMLLFVVHFTWDEIEGESIVALSYACQQGSWDDCSDRPQLWSGREVLSGLHV